jgi:hypothetical protein
MERSSFRSSLVAVGVALLATSTGVAGCYAEATTGAVVRAEYAPANVTIYPREYYEGRYVYLVGDRWYYRDGPHWVYYVREPQPLVERRVVLRRVHVHPVRESTVVHEAPPVRRHYRVERREDRRDSRRRRVD